MKFKSIKTVLYALIIIGLIAVIPVAVGRVQAENAADSTMLTLDWTQMASTAARAGLSEAEALEQLSTVDGERIVGGIIYKEPTFEELDAYGDVSVLTGAELAQQLGSGSWHLADGSVEVKDSYSYIVCSADYPQQLIYDNLDNKTSAVVEKLSLIIGNAEAEVVGTSYPYTDLMKLGAGYSPVVVGELQAMGFEVIPQLRSWPKMDAEAIDAVFDAVAPLGFTIVGFNDEYLPGVTNSNWSAISKQIAAKFAENGWTLMQAEMFKQVGFATLAAAMDYHVVRMHSISDTEIEKYDNATVFNRFALACAERNMGVALIRVRASVELPENAALIAGIADAVQAKGRPLGEAGTLPGNDVALWNMLLIALGTASGGVLLLQRLKFGKLAYILPAVCFIGAAGLMVIGKAALACKLLALAAVLIFPTVSAMYFLRYQGRSVVGSIVAIIGMTCASLIGAAYTVGLLSTSSYMTSINVFSGVKIGIMLPLVIMAAYLWVATNRENGHKGNILEMLRDLMKKPVTIGILVLLGFIGLVLLVYMMRSGNVQGGVSSLELTFRSFMDSVMSVRPRTKEFMFGHPLMLVAMYFGFGKNLWPIAVLGMIGQVSLVNTFEHLHTPLLVSVLRTINGLVLGIVLGLILILVIKLAIKLVKKYLPSAE